MKIAEILTEIVWEDHLSAIEAAKKFPNAWIHFTQIPKLGINPRKSHRDPPGIYFYPCRWLSSYEAGLSQYAVTYPYYFICRIAPTRATINLSRMTRNQAESIANRNGWLEDYHRVIQSGALLNKENPMDRKLLRKPGGTFYAALDYLANIEGRSWLQLLKGVDALIDNGSGIISGDEVYQACVINRGILTILDQGQNVDNYSRIHARMMKELADEFGGKFYYKNKIPTIEVIIDGNPIKMAFDAGNWRIHLEYYRNGNWFKDIERYENISTGDYANVLQTLRYYLKTAAGVASQPRGDMFWTGDRITQLFNMIFDRPQIRSYSRDEEIHYGTSWDASIKTGLYADLTSEDTLILRGYVTGGYPEHTTYAQVEMTLSPGTDIGLGAAQFLSLIWQQLETNMPNADWNNPRHRGIIKFRDPPE